MAKKKSESKPTCFVVMPITTPIEKVEEYNKDPDHFKHVLKYLFVPAIEKIGYTAIPPIARGSEMIMAEIIGYLINADLVLIDCSILNPNVFFEFGIRTALNKPVAIVKDHLTGKIPFDITPINHHPYNGMIDGWTDDNELNNLSNHLKNCLNKTENDFWKRLSFDITAAPATIDYSSEGVIQMIWKQLSTLQGSVNEINNKVNPSDDFHVKTPFADIGNESRMRRTKFPVQPTQQGLNEVYTTLNNYLLNLGYSFKEFSIRNEGFEIIIESSKVIPDDHQMKLTQLLKLSGYHLIFQQ